MTGDFQTSCSIFFIRLQDFYVSSLAVRTFCSLNHFVLWEIFNFPVYTGRLMVGILATKE